MKKHLIKLKKLCKNLISVILIVALNLCYEKTFSQDDDNPIPDEVLACSWQCPIVIEGLVKPIPPNHIYTVQNANELYEVLSCLYQDWQIQGLTNPYSFCFPNSNQFSFCSGTIPSCINPITIIIAPGYNIDFKTLTDANGNPIPHVFPIEVPPGVTILGDYDIKDIQNDGTSYGTRIFFPYLYGGEGVESTCPPAALLSPSGTCNIDLAFVFKLNDGAKFKNICLVGPTNNMVDFRYLASFANNCTNQPYPSREGMAGGVLVQGNNCEVAYCEIYGFPLGGLLLQNMIRTNMGRITTPSACYVKTDLDACGTFSFHNNLIYN